MIDQSRHVALRPTPWASNEASAAIDEIISDALAKFENGFGLRIRWMT
jgi:hypothetical protein